MYCPNCNMFATNTLVCVYCGQKLSLPPVVEPSRPVTRKSRSGFVFKAFLVLTLAGVIYGVYWSYFKEKGITSSDIPSGSYPSGNLPSYMTHGSINLEEKIVKGKTNIVDFYSEYCPPCRKMAPLLKRLDAKRRDIALIKIDINRRGVMGIDWNSPIAKQFKLRSIPHFIIVSPSGKLRYEGTRAYNFVIRQLRTESII